MHTLLQSNQHALKACSQIGHLNVSFNTVGIVNQLWQGHSARYSSCSHLLSQLQVAGLDSLGFLTEGNALEEGNSLLLPEDAVVLLLQVDEGVAGLAVPDVGQSSLHSQPKVVTDHLRTVYLSDEQDTKSIAGKYSTRSHSSSESN